jgi:thiol:disulfide interchange protein DsbC
MKHFTSFLAALTVLWAGAATAEPFTTDVSTLPMQYAFKRTYGDGSRNIYIFCDLDCPHCQRTESFMPALNNVTVYEFVMPVPSYHPDAPRKTNAIWCSEDKVAAWNAWFATRDLPADAKDCRAPLTEINDYAHANNIFLPAVIFEDGQTYHAEDFIYATQTFDKLNSLIDEHSKK